jgi:site-specific DNA recombinase
MNTQKRKLKAANEAPLIRVALYLRVSTGRQAEHDLSIPDQRAQLLAWCEANSFEATAEFVEPGASATDDRRPVFQQMIERACDGEHAFDIIAVHSYSRFFRDAFGQEFYLRKLAKHGVKLISITQPLGDDDDPAQAMMRKVIALFDEYQSKENAKHVLRNMKLNAQQGFWNGSPVPLGYRLSEVEKRGTKIKKALAIDAVDAETVRLIYNLYLYGDGTSGALGVKELAKWLNSRGYRSRTGATFGTGILYKTLTNTVYIGQWKFNQISARTGKRKPASEVVTCSVPAIVDEHVFEQVQRQLHARGPKVVAPRVTTGPVLLTGLAVCASCRGAMTSRTGTSKTGVLYYYYTCSTCMRKGKIACKGRSIRMAKLDALVSTHLAEKLFQPERLSEILSSITARRAEKAGSLNARISELQREITEADDKLKRLYRLVEEGLVEVDDVLKDRLNVLKADRERAKSALDRAKSHEGLQIRIDPQLIEEFGREMRGTLTDGSIAFRKAYLQSVIDVIEVDDNVIRIKGDKDLLEKAILARRTGTDRGSHLSTKWRSLGESNPCFSLERDKPRMLAFLLACF